MKIHLSVISVSVIIFVACSSVPTTTPPTLPPTIDVAVVQTEAALSVFATQTASVPTPNYPATIEVLSTRSAMVAQPTPTDVPPTDVQATSTAKPTTKATQVSKPNPTSVPKSTLKSDVYVCNNYAEIRDGPSKDAKLVSLGSSGETVIYYSKQGEWYYLGHNEQGVNYYIHESFLCPLSEKPPATVDLCTGYRLPQTDFILRYNSSMKPIRGITRPNGIMVYYDISDAEFWEPQRGGMKEFGCPAAAEAQGYVDGKP